MYGIFNEQKKLHEYIIIHRHVCAVVKLIEFNYVE